MIGIVIVSHSLKLAEGVVDLINMMAPEVHVSVAGGKEDGSYGVTAPRIRQALREMKSEDNALIFMDLGSSVSMVENILDEFPRGKFHLMDCPLVEGSIGAAVVIAANASFQDVIRIAKESRNAFKF